MKQQRAYRYRCYPTPTQAAVLARTFGCARFVYNWALRLRTDAYYERQERLSYADLSAALTTLKQQDATVWLNEVSSVPLQQALRHLESALHNFFAGRAKYPTFHKKHRAQSVTYASSAFRWNAQQCILTLAKMVSPLHLHLSRPLPNGATPTTITVSRDTAGRYFVSILLEDEVAPLPVTTGQVGIDLGLHDVVVLDSGEKVGNPRFFQADEMRLAKAQRRLAKKKLGSKNRDKARRKVARIHARIADRRNDFLHQLSTRMIRENQTICVESLRAKAMVKHPTLAKAIHDVGWGEFVRQLDYKAAWYGRTLVKIDRWYPSSKRCHSCGHIVDSLTLAMRQWTCPECGAIHDRDINAAQNIVAVGLTVSASGETVRPTKASARVGTSRCPRRHVSVKEESPGLSHGECQSCRDGDFRDRKRLRRMPRRPQRTPSPDDANSLFADLLDDEVGTTDGAADDSSGPGGRGIPPAISYQSVDAAVAPETALNDPDLPYWLALDRVRGIGPARFRLLLEGFGSARGVWQASPSDWQAAGLDSRTVASFEQHRRRIEPAAEVDRLITLRVGTLRIIDPTYPRLLQEIPLPPPVLYVRGALTPQDEWALGIVGTRRASPYGRQMTEKLAGELARQSITIISGLARGIDTVAHLAALEAGGRTLAVLDCGPDLVYPPENARLAVRIVEQGAIVTRFSPVATSFANGSTSMQ